MEETTDNKIVIKRDNVEIYPDGMIIDTDTGMGKLYMGECLTRKFLEVFGREPTDNEYMGDWYDIDFETKKGKIK